MQYLKYTHVDFRTRRSVLDYPAKNGPDFPAIPGLVFDFAEESKYPTNAPTFYGTITPVEGEIPEYDHAAAPVWGVISVLSETEYQAAKDAELEARRAIYNQRVDDLRDQILSQGFYFEFSDQPGTVQTRDQKDMDNVHKNGSAAMALILQGAPETPMQFRDAENFIHTMPAMEMLQMTMGAMAFGSSVYAVSWAHKDHLNGGNGIEKIATLEELIAYSIHSDWPVSAAPAEEEEEDLGDS